MEIKFGQLEWKIDKTPNGRLKVTDKNGFSIANLTSTVAKENEANAKLIAAVPTMLKMLIEARERIEELEFPLGNKNGLTTPTLLGIDEAIKSATN